MQQYTSEASPYTCYIFLMQATLQYYGTTPQALAILDACTNFISSTSIQKPKFT
ncbi:MAG UNVERIFIED_CONTAM: hypothetical protein LVQ98_04895 [Rickettsiaceae bacterium]